VIKNFHKNWTDGLSLVVIFFGGDQCKLFFQINYACKTVLTV